MSDINITVEGGKAIRLKTAGKYCDKNIVVESTGGGSVSAPLIVHSFGYYTNGFNRESWESVTVMDRLITQEAFSGCTSLKSVTLGRNTKRINTSAFRSCASLESVNIAADSGIDAINDYAFFDCTSLTSINIPHSVTSIGGSVFKNCSSLTSITIPDSVTGIGNNAFSGCSSLTSISLPNSIAGLGGNLFLSCDALTEINYSGTIAEWQAIDTYGIVDWGKTVTVHCTDGDTTASQSGD